ncbi:hypothetical protein H1R17_01860 [Flavobacterium sp. xlx-214]|uniref:hypothetical protein n=1 Tax=unclassified Flavobacterium TaxID=196869 RepID=UPI0013D64A22|nr:MULTISPECIES: hypothetical protein [unclassified Flavobacterium]MBA5792768.1 hypothetical protein [Flavobacterium sp. xlx-221]QMI83905.1 hypothetical protein H1R17_01860 [Flavobacterium sp. xlx-214]
MTKKGFLAGLFLLGISVTAFAKNSETAKQNISINDESINKIFSSETVDGDQSGGGNTGANGTILIPIKPPKPPVILK